MTKSSGAKAAMVVNTPTVTGLNTPRTPRRVEALPWPPASCSEMMFSPTTTASSTTSPSTMMRPNSEIILMLTSKGAKNMTAPRNEIGTPIATHVAKRRSNIMAKNKNTRAKPSMPLRISSPSRCCNMSVWSSQIAISIPASAVYAFNSFLTAAAMVNASSASDFCTLTKRLWRPLNC